MTKKAGVSAVCLALLGVFVLPATPAAAAAPNYNDVTFPPIVARQVRVLVTPAAGRAAGIKELQIFDTRSGHGH